MTELPEQPRVKGIAQEQILELWIGVLRINPKHWATAGLYWEYWKATEKNYWETETQYNQQKRKKDFKY